MTEKEKMLRGMLYDADDSTLCADRVRAKELCHATISCGPRTRPGCGSSSGSFWGKRARRFA